MRVLDSHLHLWDPDRFDYDWLAGPLRGRFAAEEILAARGTGVHTAIFVQADCAERQYLDEVDWAASLADGLGIVGIVAGARLDRGAATVAHLDALRERPLVVGVRHLLQSAPTGFAASPEFRAGAAALVERDLSFDACVRGVAQIDDVTALATDLPDLRIVLDHVGKPEVGTASDPRVPADDWRRALERLAQRPNVFCKLSGLPAEAGGDWDPAQMTPFFDTALAVFGPDRLMVGSDWPVSALVDGRTDAAAHATWIDAVTDWVGRRGIDADAVLRRTAERFYRVAVR